MKKEKSIYEKLGVDPSKENVKTAFKGIIDTEYPNAFVNIITDPFDSSRVITKHLDGDGSKFVQRLLHFYYGYGNADEVFGGMVDDALSMNLGDIAASGFVFGPVLVADVLNIGPLGDLKNVIMASIAKRFHDLFDLYSAYGFKIKFLGGETADLPDQVRSGVFDISVTAFAGKDEVIKGDIEDGDVIYGLHSDGKAVWEDGKNSGLMSNGLTMARSVLMLESYNRSVPELRPKLKREEDFYKGRFKVDDRPGVLRGMSVGEALISPTRQWAIFIREFLSELYENDAYSMLHGITMNTGGGATKIKNIGSGMIYEKKMPEPSPIFKLIQAESGELWQNMYQSFNCGIGLDVVGEDNLIFHDCLQRAAKSCQIKASLLGKAYKNPNGENNEVKLQTLYGNFKY
jgi:phosphoribosylaminoimidazole (AIR) synthetase